MLHGSNRVIILYLLGLAVVVVLTLLTGVIVFPADNLYLFPPFSQEKWNSPGNSLLIDPLFQFEPWRQFAKQMILSGNLPFWNDLNGKGAPFLANPQAAVFYPIHIFYYLFPAQIALNVIPYTKIFLFGFFTFLFLRSLKLSPIAVQIGTVAFVSSGFITVWLLWPHTNVFIFLPLLLYVTERLLVSKSPSGLSVLTAFVYLFAVLGGHPGTLLHLALFHGLYAVFRLQKRIKKLLQMGVFSFLGITMGSFQLFPFFEYLQYSRALELRNTLDDVYFLPWQSFVLHFMPFLFGAPHMPFYKAITASTNFQETIGGYVGAALFICVAIAVVTRWRMSTVRFFACITVIFWLIIYKIWPFWLLSQLPVFNLAGSSRLIGFTGFSLLVLAAIGIDRLIKSRTLALHTVKIVAASSLAGVVLLVTGFVIARDYSPITYSPKTYSFSIFLFFHLLFLLLSTFLFFFAIHLLKKHSVVARVLLIGSIISQTVFLFWNYTPINSAGLYYPQTKLIKKLKALPVGTYLEIGNLTIPPNINLVYGLSQAENDDAMQLGEYRAAFDTAFPVRNRMKVVDAVTYERLQEFGIRYIISDHDPNLARYPVQPTAITYSAPITEKDILSVEFVSPATALRGIRVLTANFNRHNSCTLQMSVSEKKTEEVLSRISIPCEGIRDNTYYTVPVSVALQKGESYTLRVEAQKTTQENAVALWVDEKKRPYAELLFKDDAQNLYQLLWKKNGVSLWEVPGASDIVLDGTYTYISKSPQRLELSVNASRDTLLQIKQPFFPGWQAYREGQEVPIKDLNPFIGVQVRKGRQIVVLQYTPRLFYIGIAVSSLAATLVIGYAIHQKRRVRGLARR